MTGSYSVRIGVSLAKMFIRNHVSDEQEVLYCDRNVPSAKMISQSKYVDLVVCEVSSDMIGQTINDHEYLTTLLVASECPVFIVPAGYCQTKEIVLVYDGSFASFVTIKQFATLFPKMFSYRVTLLHTGSPQDEACYTHLLSWLHRHYGSVKEAFLENATKPILSNFIRNASNSLFVMASTYKNAVAYLYRQFGCAAFTSAIYIRPY